MNTESIKRENPPETSVVADTSALAAKYRQLSQTSAENIIELGRIVAQAKQLGGQSLSNFCDAVNLHPDGSTFRKHACIGENADRLKPFTDRLPVSWTTIYQLAHLPEADFDVITSNEKFGPTITAKEISEILGKPTGKGEEFTVALDLRGLDADDQRAVYREIEGLRESYAFKVRCSEALNAVVGAGSRTATLSAELSAAA